MADDLVRLRALIPGNLPKHIQDDVLQDMWLALYSGEVTMERLMAPGGVRPYLRRFYVANFEQAGRAIPFDVIAFAARAHEETDL